MATRARACCEPLLPRKTISSSYETISLYRSREKYIWNLFLWSRNIINSHNQVRPTCRCNRFDSISKLSNLEIFRISKDFWVIFKPFSDIGNEDPMMFGLLKMFWAVESSRFLVHHEKDTESFQICRFRAKSVDASLQKVNLTFVRSF